MYKLAYDWQTLIAGALALFGAWITVRSIKRQIKQADDAANDKIGRDERAAKAILPLGLSELSQYASSCIKFLNQFYSQASTGTEVTNIPQLPSGVTLILQECVRSADPSVAQQIAILLGKLQIQRARLDGLIIKKRERSLLEHEIDTNIIDAADLYARTSQLYNYARDLDGVRQLAPSNELLSAFILAGFSDDHSAMKEVYRREKRAKETS
jgi:hypothetical protein